MSIRKRLIISHVLMLFIPVFLALTCFIVSFKTYGNQYWESMEAMFRDENGIYSAQSIIYAYRNSLLNQAGSDAGEKNINNLKNALSEMNYHVRIQVNNQMVFDSLTENDEETLKQYIAPSHDFPGNLTLSDGGCSIIRNSFETADGLCEITAVHPENHTAPDAQATFFQKYILMFFLILSLFTSAAIILTNTILSHHVSRMILEPLNILKTGTREIADGNLDWELSYQKMDEFGDVCREFDRMRGQLKKSVETQLQYEENRRELIAGISHDLRTPLTSIKGYVEGLQDGIANTSEKQARYYEAIHMRALDMEALVDSLSLFNRLESKNYHYHLEPVDMSARISRLLENYEEDARQKGE